MRFMAFVLNISARSDIIKTFLVHSVSLDSKYRRDTLNNRGTLVTEVKVSGKLSSNLVE